MVQDLTDDMSTLNQVMAWCCQATSHYLNQGWLRSMSLSHNELEVKKSKHIFWIHMYQKKRGRGQQKSDNTRWELSQLLSHDDVIKWKHFPHYWPFVPGIHRSPVNSPHKGQWRRALKFSLICVWINGWVNNGEAGDLRRHRAYCDFIVMIFIIIGHTGLQEFIMTKWSNIKATQNI